MQEEQYKQVIEILESQNLMLGNRIKKLKLENKELNEKFSLYGVGSSFLNDLIEKHKANKKIALDNCKTMKESKEYPWYDASFNNELLFVFDLEDLKIRGGM
jgi:hypothetical protein